MTPFLEQFETLAASRRRLRVPNALQFIINNITAIITDKVLSQTAVRNVKEQIFSRAVSRVEALSHSHASVLSDKTIFFLRIPRHHGTPRHCREFGVNNNSVQQFRSTPAAATNKNATTAQRRQRITPAALQLHRSEQKYTVIIPLSTDTI